MVDRKKFDHALAMRQQLEAHYPDRNFQDAFQRPKSCEIILKSSCLWWGISVPAKVPC